MENKKFESNADVILSNKGEMKSSAITGPVARSVQICGQGLFQMQAILYYNNKILIVKHIMLYYVWG